MKFYRAIATLADGDKRWDVVIYSGYKSMEEALEGARQFATHDYTIVRIQIEEARVGCGVCKHWEKQQRYEPCKSCENWSKFELREGLT